MTVLLLGPGPNVLGEWLEDRGERVVIESDPITVATAIRHEADILISYGYRYILPPEVLAPFPGRAFNLHISYLPWNRGADPNLWSFVDDTPKGVTIHHLDAGVDTGDIVDQRLVDFGPDETLRSSYDLLQEAILRLFRELWPVLRTGHAPRRPQSGPGSTHRSRDKEAILSLLDAGWDTPVADLRRRISPGR